MQVLTNVLYRPKKALRFLLISNQNFSFWHTKIYVCLLIKSLPPKMNQTAKRHHNNKIKNNKELILQSLSFTIRFTDSVSGQIQARFATYLTDDQFVYYLKSSFWFKSKYKTLVLISHSCDDCSNASFGEHKKNFWNSFQSSQQNIQFFFR